MSPDFSDTGVWTSDQLIAKESSSAADNPNYRKSVLDQWQELISQMAPVDFLFAANRTSVVNSRVHGVVWSGVQGLIDPWKWTVDATK